VEVVGGAHDGGVEAVGEERGGKGHARHHSAQCS
jgi:hypothetical protein